MLSSQNYPLTSIGDNFTNSTYWGQTSINNFHVNKLEKANNLIKNCENVKAMIASQYQKQNTLEPDFQSKILERDRRAIEAQQDNIYNISSLYTQTENPLVNRQRQESSNKFSAEKQLSLATSNIYSPTLLKAFVTLNKHSGCDANINEDSISNTTVAFKPSDNRWQHLLLNSKEYSVIYVNPGQSNINDPAIQKILKESGLKPLTSANSSVVESDIKNPNILCTKVVLLADLPEITKSENLINKLLNARLEYSIQQEIQNPEAQLLKNNLLPYSLTEVNGNFIFSSNNHIAKALQQKEFQDAAIGTVTKYLVGWIIGSIAGVGIFSWVASKFKDGFKPVNDFTELEVLGNQEEHIDV